MESAPGKTGPLTVCANCDNNVIPSTHQCSMFNCLSKMRAFIHLYNTRLSDLKLTLGRSGHDQLRCSAQLGKSRR